MNVPKKRVYLGVVAMVSFVRLVLGRLPGAFVRFLELSRKRKRRKERNKCSRRRNASSFSGRGQLSRRNNARTR